MCKAVKKTRLGTRQMCTGPNGNGIITKIDWIKKKTNSETRTLRVAWQYYFFEEIYVYFRTFYHERLCTDVRYVCTMYVYN